MSPFATAARYPLMRARSILAVAMIAGLGSGGAAVGSARQPSVAADQGPSCVNLDQVVARRGTAADVLTLDMLGKRSIAARLVAPCPHLTEIDRTYTLVLDLESGQRLCRGDRFHVVDPVVARIGGANSYQWCRIARFEPVPAR